VLLAGLLVLVVAGALGWFVALPHHRPSLQAGERYGIDVSNHQGAIDWSAVARDDITSAYIKATEGETFVDERFAANWAGAASAGVRRGAYHFFSLCSPGASQAANFLRVVPADPEALPPALDLEFGACENRPDRATVQREITAFVEAVEREVGRRVVVYALPSFTTTYPVPEQFVRERWVRRLFLRPERPGWSIWQVSDRARVDGVDGPVDLNVWRSAGTAGPRRAVRSGA
jgi:lysozyme